jgi:hypothetical protein
MKTRHGTRQRPRSDEIAPSAIAAMHAACSANGSLSSGRSRCGPENSMPQKALERTRGSMLACSHAAASAWPTVREIALSGTRRADCPRSRASAPAEERARRSQQPASSRFPDEVGTLDLESVDDGDRIRDAQRDRIVRSIVGLVASRAQVGPGGVNGGRSARRTGRPPVPASHPPSRRLAEGRRDRRTG